jgi:charged multivesicular body protein 6
MSNQEEDEVEDELMELERQVNGVKEGQLQQAEELPDAPTADLPQQSVLQKERWERRQREQEEALLAS